MNITSKLRSESAGEVCAEFAYMPSNSSTRIFFSTFSGTPGGGNQGNVTVLWLPSGLMNSGYAVSSVPSLPFTLRMQARHWFRNSYEVAEDEVNMILAGRGVRSASADSTLTSNNKVGENEDGGTDYIVRVDLNVL